MNELIKFLDEKIAETYPRGHTAPATWITRDELQGIRRWIDRAIQLERELADYKKQPAMTASEAEGAVPVYIVSAVGKPDYQAKDWNDVIRYINGLPRYTRKGIEIWEKDDEPPD